VNLCSAQAAGIVNASVVAIRPGIEPVNSVQSSTRCSATAMSSDCSRKIS
jgi:hypothetical protein